MRPTRSLQFRRSLNIAALAVAVAVFPLIWMGGLVTTHGAGLSVPDWPNSYGYNMFLFPPSQWLGGVFFEHTHRLLGTLAGFLAILLTLVAWGPARTDTRRRVFGGLTIVFGALSAITIVVAILIAGSGIQSEELKKNVQHIPVSFISLTLIFAMAYFCRRREEQRWIRWLTVIELSAICVQGLLGGLRVDLMNLTLAMIHGCFAQAVFALTAFTALATSKWWNVDVYEFRLGSAGPKPLKVGLGLAILATLVIYGQLIAGAIMRHKGAGLAIPTLPLAFGHWLPPMNTADLDAANAVRSWKYELTPVTLGQMWMHFAHRVGAVCVTLAVLSEAIYVLICLRREGAATLSAVILLVLLPTQVTLGILTVWLKKPADLTSLHVAVGALTLITASTSAAVLWRLLQRRRAMDVVPETEPATLAAA